MIKKIPNLTETLSNAVSFDMVHIEGDEFNMGISDDEAFDYGKPVHRVRVSSFYLGRYPTIQSLWTTVMGNNPSHFKGDQRPVETVSWNDVQQFLSKLNGITGKPYRLPSEAEWEYAARGGLLLEGEGYVYAGSDKLKQVGWYDENSDDETHEVGLKYPNELGLYDLSGNVWEWCQDQWHESYREAPDDGAAWEDRDADSYRVMRGGSWFYNSKYCRVTYRSNYSPMVRYEFLGFRLALSPKKAP